MDYVLDTNILLIYLRDKRLVKYIDKKYQLLSVSNNPIISLVSIGEIKSIALRNGWSVKQQSKITEFTKQFLIADINAEAIIQRYAEIDAFSQRKLPGKQLLSNARNMGKNDLWIASTASILNAPLLTTVKDFHHLDNEFLHVEFIDFESSIKSIHK